MDDEHDPVGSPNSSLAGKFRDKRYRDSYVATHTRSVLARQIRNLRGDRTQSQFAERIGKRQTVVSRLESPAYGGWSLRTMLEIARKCEVAVLCRFVDFPTFLKYSRDLSDKALSPAPYDDGSIGEWARQTERQGKEDALKALFSEPADLERSPGALDAMQKTAFEAPRSWTAPSPANDDVSSGADMERGPPSLLSASK